MSEPLPPGAGGGDESEAELSQSLARTKTRSYGSTASVAAPLAEKYIQHPVTPSDTLRGLALRYGVTMEQIKRANKLFTSDCIFLRKTLIIPVISDKGLLFNGLNSLESPENESRESFTLCEESSTSPSPEDIENRPIHPEELSAKDFLQRLDLQIKLSTQAAAKTIQEDDNGTGDATYKDYSYAESSYQSHH
ncbi:lysM and putative peptidoglycan-binding domain-containing protein 2 [Rhincodon typus]|uniref:lysM and putative peptidoglycan-binding domain-containing protein 2 n=1 Tax=Rhincodon typus TaxID=259920 RepID=UPI00202EE5E4|nr:lysM and putative peptidoglycan-binding domain-containing protein 2 [Rhincodon typus]XP_048472013.1 lysM and putative peptidoglycan-binding domain-containing protein 2 [Rhincodon typus]